MKAHQLPLLDGHPNSVQGVAAEVLCQLALHSIDRRLGQRPLVLDQILRSALEQTVSGRFAWMTELLWSDLEALVLVFENKFGRPLQILVCTFVRQVLQSFGNIQFAILCLEVAVQDEFLDGFEFVRLCMQVDVFGYQLALRCLGGLLGAFQRSIDL